MTKRMVDHFSRSRGLAKQTQILDFVIGGLLFHAGCQGQNPLSAGVNIEDLFNAVQILADRENLEAAPFIASWHNLVDHFDRYDAPQSDGLHRAIHESLTKQLVAAFSEEPASFDSRRIDDAVASALQLRGCALHRGSGTYYSSNGGVGDAIASYLKLPTNQWRARLSSVPSSFSFDREFRRDRPAGRASGGKQIASVNEHMIRTLAEIVWIDDVQRVAYLEPIIRLAKQQRRLVIATLNYDNAVECLAEGTEGSVACNTGIDTWPTSGHFEPTADGIHLLKLHGSIDWVYAAKPRQAGAIPQTIVTKVAAGEMQRNGYRPAVIFGQRNKLTADGPFLDILRAFRSELSKSQRVTVIGYSFRDEHVNTFLRQWLNQNLENRMRIISLDFDTSRVPFVRQLKVFRRDVPDRLEVINVVRDRCPK